jgi:cytochrome c peroxidase
LRLTSFILTALFFVGCENHEVEPSAWIPNLSELDQAPSGFPEIPFPSENAFSIEKWKLGKKLFYDTQLSIDNSISCGSCHDAKLAFSDDIALSPGANQTIGTRNAPTLANVAYLPYFTREGGVPTLEMQVLVPIQEHNEFNSNILDLANFLANDTLYTRLSQEAFGRNIDPYVITRAIATFERTIISGNSPFDEFTYQGNSSALTKDQLLGMSLFFSERTQCSTCHNGFNLTDNTFQNNGLYEPYLDMGRYRFTGDSQDLALFKVPTLRNVEITGPYMHDGSIETLFAVIEHYNEGGKTNAQKSNLIKPLGLNTNEKLALVSFLESLTDTKLITNELFAAP